MLVMTSAFDHPQALFCHNSHQCVKVPCLRPVKAGQSCSLGSRSRQACHQRQARSCRSKTRQRDLCRASTAEKAIIEDVQKQHKPLRIMIAGAPAAGKGTQCVKIVEKHGLVHISAGDLLRAEVQAGTEAGKRAKQFMDEGHLVPNEVVVDMVVNRLQQEDAQSKGWLLDGYPRSGEQAEAIQAAGIHPDAFILINVNDDELVERVVGRRLDPETGKIYHLTYNRPPPDVVDRLIQRSDDTEEKLRNRLAGHHQNVKAVIGYYKQEMMEVDGSQSMAEVAEAIDKCLTKFERERC